LQIGAVGVVSSQTQRTQRKKRQETLRALRLAGNLEIAPKFAIFSPSGKMTHV